MRSVRLTVQEIVVLQQTAKLYNEYCSLTKEQGEGYHPEDHADVLRHLHAIQRIVMARLARRTDPEILERI